MSFGRSTGVPFKGVQPKEAHTFSCAPILAVGGLVSEAPRGVLVPSLAWKAYLKLTFPLCLCYEFFCHNGDPFMDSGTDLLMFVICCNL